MFEPRDIEIDPKLADGFISLDDAKDFLGVSGDTEDDAISSLIKTASQNIEAYCNTLFEQRTVTETLFPDESVVNLLLTHAPAIELNSLTIDDVEQDVADFRFMKASGIVRSADGVSISGTKIEIVYDAGYATEDLPEGLIEATKEYIRALRFVRSRDTSIKSESVDGVGSVSYETSGSEMSVGVNGTKIPADVAALVDHLVKRF